jgi:hypothetical protein
MTCSRQWQKKVTRNLYRVHTIFLTISLITQASVSQCVSLNITVIIDNHTDVSQPHSVVTRNPHAGVASVRPLSISFLSSTKYVLAGLDVCRTGSQAKLDARHLARVRSSGL